MDAFVFVLLTIAVAAPLETLRIAVAPIAVKVRPDRPLPASTSRADRMALTLARGECEGAQLIVSAGAWPLEALTVDAKPLRNDGGGTLPVSLARVAFIEIRTPSNTEGDLGLWPDPLVPAIDPVAHEPRNAFPVTVPAGRHQPVYVEVCAPPRAAPGRYRGLLGVRVGGVERARVPLEVDLRAVTIPATSSMPVTFGVSGKSLTIGHYGEKRGMDERLVLVRRYAESALRHRISLHTMSMRPPDVTRTRTGVAVDFTQWDAEIAPFLDGTASPDGARFSAIDLRTPPELERELLAPYYRAVEAHFRERGWLDRLFAYVMDEPRPAQEEELLARLAALEAAPGIRRMVTTALHPPLTGHVDIWTPNLNCLEVKKTPREFCQVDTPRSLYRPREARGERLWWYQSCSSHGCKGGPFGRADLDEYFTGWPSYMVDADGASTRVMGWLAFAHDLGGELYFDMANAFNLYDRTRGAAVDPWDSVWAFGGNGDGTLFYPGRPDRIGGHTHVPVASQRLVLIRDGLEERELLVLLAATGPAGAREARALATSIAPRLSRFEHDPKRWASARTQLFDALGRQAGAAATPLRAPMTPAP